MEDAEQEAGADPQQDGHIEKEIAEKDISVIVSSGGQCCPGFFYFTSRTDKMVYYNENKMHPQARIHEWWRDVT